MAEGLGTAVNQQNFAKTKRRTSIETLSPQKQTEEPDNSFGRQELQHSAQTKRRMSIGKLCEQTEKPDIAFDTQEQPRSRFLDP